MKKVLLTFAILIVAAAAYASTAMTIDPSEMKNGETKTLTDGGTTIKVTRNGEALDLKIEGAGETRKLTITRSGSGDIRIERNGRIVIDGEEFRVPHVRVPRPRVETRHMKTMFVCPKDGTTLRVPEDKSKDTFKCPVDGTTMEKRKGNGFSFYFDDDAFRSFETLDLDEL